MGVNGCERGQGRPKGVIQKPALMLRSQPALQSYVYAQGGTRQDKERADIEVDEQVSRFWTLRCHQ